MINFQYDFINNLKYFILYEENIQETILIFN